VFGGRGVSDLPASVTNALGTLTANLQALALGNLTEQDKHLKAITSRPLLLTAIAERIRHARQTTLRIASAHGRAAWASRALTEIAAFLGRLVETAEQLTPTQRWYGIRSHALRLDGRELRPPTRLPAQVV
jgi:hypothetical protein